MRYKIRRSTGHRQTVLLPFHQTAHHGRYVAETSFCKELHRGSASQSVVADQNELAVSLQVRKLLIKFTERDIEIVRKICPVGIEFKPLADIEKQKIFS